MNKQQWVVAGGALVLFLALWLGFDTKSASHESTDRSRSIQGEPTSFPTLLADAKAHLSPAEGQQVADLEKQSMMAADTASHADALKQLSGFWYRTGNIAIAGGYADSVAIVENTDAAWSVAGGTYFAGLQNAGDDETIRKFCAGRAVKAFENAASVNPDKVEHRVNIALVYAENPPADNPMKAVLMLRDLESKHPEAPSVYNALGRLAIKTGQWERAIERLEKSLSLDPKNPNTPCLLAQAYSGAGNGAKAKEFAEKCN